MARSMFVEDRVFSRRCDCWLSLDIGEKERLVEIARYNTYSRGGNAALVAVVCFSFGASFLLFVLAPSLIWGARAMLPFGAALTVLFCLLSKHLFFCYQLAPEIQRLCEAEKRHSR